MAATAATGDRVGVQAWSSSDLVIDTLRVAARPEPPPAVPSPAWRSRSTRGSPRSRTTTGGTATRARLAADLLGAVAAPTPRACSTRDAVRAATAPGSPSTVTSSASTCRPTRSRSCKARRPTTVPVRASVDALPFADGAFDAVVGLTVLYTVPDDARRGRASSRGCSDAGAPCSWSNPRSPRSGERTTRPCTAAAGTAAPSWPSWPPPPGSRCGARPTPTRSSLRPRPTLGALDRVRRRREVAAGSDVDRARPRPGVRAAGRAERRVARPPRRARRHLGRAARYPLTADAVVARAAAPPAAIQSPARSQQRARRSRRPGRTPTCRAPGGSGAPPPR